MQDVAHDPLERLFLRKNIPQNGHQAGFFQKGQEKMHVAEHGVDGRVREHREGGDAPVAALDLGEGVAFAVIRHDAARRGEEHPGLAVFRDFKHFSEPFAHGVPCVELSAPDVVRLDYRRRAADDLARLSAHEPLNFDERHPQPPLGV